MQLSKKQHSELIHKLALQYGFDACGISAAGRLDQEAARLETWLKNGYHGKMKYMENHFDMRVDPGILVPGAKTVVSLLFNYYPQQVQKPDSYHIARYAYGEDYHDVLRAKLKSMLEDIRSAVGDVDARVFVDSGPVLERAWAEKSGLGWIGRHGLLIRKGSGSYFFIAEIILDLDCEPDAPVQDHCGSCTRCVDACPTEAILPDKTLNASRCISYLTIELKEAIPAEFSGKMQDWVFGCDICQEVCPWNRFAVPGNEEKFKPRPSLLQYGKDEWEVLSREVFSDLFRKSAVKRSGYEGLTRNIRFAKLGSTAEDQAL